MSMKLASCICWVYKQCTGSLPLFHLFQSRFTKWLIVEYIFEQTCPSSVKQWNILWTETTVNTFSPSAKCDGVPKVWKCVLCTLDWSPVANHRYDWFRVHDDLETTIWSQDDPVGKLAIRFLSCPGWSMEQPSCHLHSNSEVQQKVYSAVLSGQQKLRFHPLSHCPWCRASKTIQKSVFRANRRFEEHLAIAGTLFVHSTLGFCQGECPPPHPRLVLGAPKVWLG